MMASIPLTTLWAVVAALVITPDATLRTSWNAMGQPAPSMAKDLALAIPPPSPEVTRPTRVVQGCVVLDQGQAPPRAMFLPPPITPMPFTPCPVAPPRTPTTLPDALQATLENR